MIWLVVLILGGVPATLGGWFGKSKPMLGAGIGILFACIVGMGCQVKSYNADHAGHEAIHAQIAAELATARRGDLLVIVDKVGVVNYNFEKNNELVYRRLDGTFEPTKESVASLTESHARLIRKDSPEYDKTLGDYFRKLFQ